MRTLLTAAIISIAMTRLIRLLPALALVLLLPTAPASAASFDLPKVFAKQIARAKQKTDIDVRVPRTYRDDDLSKAYPTGFTAEDTYGFTLSTTRRCGANACFVASFSGTLNGAVAFRTRVKLARGIRGYYKPITCGGSCSPAVVQFRIDDVLYEVSAGQRKTEMVRMANEMITSGPR